MKVQVSKRALRQIARIQSWWLAHRPAASTLFLDELAEAEQQLRQNPECGTVHEPRATAAVRRILLPRTRHHLYFRYRRDRDEVTVLAVWGAPRGRAPKL